jgi:hypothetical protein
MTDEFEYRNPRATAAEAAHRPQEAPEIELPDPDVDEIQQHGDVDPSVPVSINGPVQTRQLPAPDWRVHHYNLAQADGVVEIAPFNPFRGRLLLSVSVHGIYISDTKPGCTPNDGFLIEPINATSTAIVELRHGQSVFAVGDNAAATVIGVIEELWTR